MYISQSGKTEKLAHGIADSLPHRDTFVTDLSCKEITGKVDVYLVGLGMKKEAIPLKIMEVSETLEGKTIIAFVFYAPVQLKIIYLEYLLCDIGMLLLNKAFKIKASGHVCGIVGPVILLLYVM